MSLATALLSAPELLVLDEPTVGLDPVLRGELWAGFRGLADAGTRCSCRSHVMDEADRCDDDRADARRARSWRASRASSCSPRTGARRRRAAFLRLVGRLVSPRIGAGHRPAGCCCSCAATRARWRCCCVVPCVLEALIKWVFEGTPEVFQRVGVPLVGIFPLISMFLVTSIAMLRERTTGTLERLMTMPLAKLDLLAGYGLAFAAMATVQAVLVSVVAVGLLGLERGRARRRWWSCSRC